MKFFDPRDRRRFVAERIAVLDADERDLLARLVDPAHVGSGQRQLDLVGRDLLGQAVDGVELLARSIGALRSSPHLQWSGGRVRATNDEPGTESLAGSGLVSLTLGAFVPLEPCRSTFLSYSGPGGRSIIAYPHLGAIVTGQAFPLAVSPTSVAANELFLRLVIGRSTL